MLLIVGGIIAVGIVATVIILKLRKKPEKRHWITKDGRRIFIKNKK